MRMWLAHDPHDGGRISAQPREFRPEDFPPGPDGVGWRVRVLDDLDEKVWAAMLRAEFDPDEQDRLHRGWWDAAGQEGDEPWPG